MVGGGRVGNALTKAIEFLEGPYGRGFDGESFNVVLLTVPDDEIARAATIRPGPVVGHCAGSLGLDALAPHEAFGVHPLMTITDEGAPFAGAGAAVAGSTSHALDIAQHLAQTLGMLTFEIADEDRAAYPLPASIASNFLVTLEDAAEVMLGTAGADRGILVPLVRATLENWASSGAAGALTGPIAAVTRPPSTASVPQWRTGHQSCWRCSMPSVTAPARSPRAAPDVPPFQISWARLGLRLA